MFQKIRNEFDERMIMWKLVLQTVLFIEPVELNTSFGDNRTIYGYKEFKQNHRHQQLWPRSSSLSSIPPKFHYLPLLSLTQRISILPAMELALSLEKLANEGCCTCSVAEKNKDVQLTDFVETEFLAEQVEAIKKIFEYVARLRTVCKGHGMLLLRDDEFVAVESGVMLFNALIVAV